MCSCVHVCAVFRLPLEARLRIEEECELASVSAGGACVCVFMCVRVCAAAFSTAGN